jgi:transcriptional regulator with XRE-family HTH domain
VSKPLTPAQLLAEALRVRAEAAALTQYADDLERLAAKAPLTIGPKRSMVGSNMEASPLAGKPENVRTSANRARHKSAAREAMIAGNHTAKDLANACKVGRSTANAWLNGTRGIAPEYVAKLAKAPFSIAPESWPKLS